MSTNQVKADPIESQHRRGGRGGAAHRGQSSGKGGGGSGAAPHSNHPAPTRPANTGGRRKTNGHGQAWYFPNAANGGEPILQPAHRPQQVTGNVAGPSPRRPAPQNDTPPVKQTVPPVASTPERPQPDAGRATGQQMFQFGSVSPGFGHNVPMQFPARTTSAPPNLDEQKREQAQFEASRASKHMPVLPHGPVLDHPNHLTAPLPPPQPPLGRPVIPIPMQVVASQSQGTIPQSLQPPVLQHGAGHIVQPSYSQTAKFQHAPPVIASQVATPMVGAPHIAHQMPLVSAYGFQPRPSKAIQIVNPETQEVLRFDKSDARPPVARVQSRPIPFAGGPQLNHYSSQPTPFSTTGTPYFPQNSTETPRYVYGPSPGAVPYTRGSQAVSVSSPVVPLPLAVHPEKDSAERPRDIQVLVPTPMVDVSAPTPMVDVSAPTPVIDEAKSAESDNTHVSVPTEETAVEPVLSPKTEPKSSDDLRPPSEIEEPKAKTESGEEQKESTLDIPIEVRIISELESVPVSEAPEMPIGDSSPNEEVAIVDEKPVGSDPSAEEKSEEQQQQQGKESQHEQQPELVVEVKQGNKKKNKKKLLAKADAAGTTADLYNAYKAPDEKKLEVKPVEQQPQVQQEVDIVKPEKKPTVREQVPKELEDWEDAADLPTPSPKSTGKDPEISTLKRYTRDFLLTCRDQNVTLPADFERRPEMEIILIPLSDMGGVRGGGGSMRRGPDDDRWNKPAMSPRPQDVRVDGMGPMGFRPGGISPGMRFPSPMMSLPHMVPPRGADALSWVHGKGLIPSPHASLPAMHKAANRYEIGKISDEEEAKKRQVKGILNKLTPQNFEKLFDQVQELGIETAATLTGVISQIFDKAIMEPTFCETYARFCVQLSVALPEFTGEGEKVTFKRLLLNKCQEEFERGKREEEEAEKIEEDGVSFTPEERETKRVKARRRMLGNIRFIGELYKNSMLTERIMHQCIKTLLGEYQNPDEEDVEALCKLMTTIGHLIDHTKAKAHMDAYFARILELSNNQKLPSRLRFALRDVLDLRRNDWQQRRKVEGPKKIEEVHRDAHQERLAQTSSRDSRFSRGGSSNRRNMPPPSPTGLSPMGGRGGMQNRFMQDVRKEESFIMDSRAMPMPMQHRPTDEFTFVPQGGLGRGPMRGPPGSSSRNVLGDIPSKMDYKRPGTAPNLDRGYGSREEIGRTASGFSPAERPLPGSRSLERSASDRLAGYTLMTERPVTPPTPVATRPSQPPLSEEQLKNKSTLAIQEYYSARDMKEAVQCVEELKRPDYHATMISQWVLDSFERKDVERDLLVKLLKHLRSASGPLTHDQLRDGFALVISVFEDTVMDVPKAADYLGSIMGKLVADEVLPLVEVSKLVKEENLLGSRDAINIFGAVLDTIRKEKSEEHILELYRASEVNIREFISSPQPGEVDNYLKRKNLQCLDPISPVEAYINQAFESNLPVPEILKWLETNAASLFTTPEFLRILMSKVLDHTVLPLPPGDYEVALKGRTRKYSNLLKKVITGNSKVTAASHRQYIVAIQQFAHAHGHPSGLMTALFDNFYTDEVIPEIAFVKWQDDVNDTTPGREQAIREVGKWLKWLAEAPEESDD